MSAIVEHPAALDAAAALRAAGHSVPLAEGVEIGLISVLAPGEFAATIRALVLRGPAACAASEDAANGFARRLLERGHATALLVAAPGSVRLIETAASAHARGM